MDRDRVVRVVSVLLLAGCLVLPPATGAREPGSRSAVLPNAEIRLPHDEIQKRLARYVPAEIGVPAGKADAKTLKVLKKLVEASDAVDRVYWDQVSDTGAQMLGELSSLKDPQSRDTAAFLRIQYGPWDRFADNEPFIGRQTRPDGANLYPADCSRRELEQWVAEHPGDKGAMFSPYTVVRRANGGLTAVPYSKAYAEPLDAAAKALRQAAALTTCKGLEKFLEARADAFGDDDYYQSDILWMDAECPVDVAIGPYEYYDDRLMGLKTSFQSVVTLTDADQTARYASLGKHWKDLLANLPIPDELRGRVELVKSSPITVADEVYAAGQSRAGFQIRAYILPNDERVRLARGTRHVILRNVVDARFHKLLEPVAREVLVPEQAAQVSDEAYLDLLLMWQMAHGIAPKAITLPGGAKTTARALLKQRHGIIEAARAEAVALMNALYLVDEKVFAPTLRMTIPITYLASLFESFRYGTTDTHGMAKLLVYNYLSQNGAFRYDPGTRRFSVNYDRLPNTLRNLTAELLTVEIVGDYARAGQDLFDYGIVPGEVRAKLNDLRSLPLDILPVYTIQKP